MIVAKAIGKALKKDGSKKKGMLGKVASKIAQKKGGKAARAVRKAGANVGRAKAAGAAAGAGAQARKNMIDEAGARMRTDGSVRRGRDMADRRKARFRGRYNEDVGGR